RIMPEDRQVGSARIPHQVVVAFIEKGQVVIEVLVVVECELERVGAFVVVGQIHDRRALSGLTKLGFEPGGYGFRPAHAISERRAATEHDDALFSRPLPSGNRTSIAPDVHASGTLKPGMKIDI